MDYELSCHRFDTWLCWQQEAAFEATEVGQAADQF